ncbi:hypothetical protein VZT92_018709 [Zoarces viviparus]|uniref:Uncharacterized protein n=1 Tax=Zoarces viviparus TaxID=48416 RepID=A0AAW1EJN1_ZOAVI
MRPLSPSSMKEAEELDHLTHENQQLASESKRLQSELGAALNERKLDYRQLQGDRGACSRLEEAIGKQQAWSSRAFLKRSRSKRRSLALEKSRIADEFLGHSLKYEKKGFDQMLLEKQAAVDPPMHGRWAQRTAVREQDKMPDNRTRQQSHSRSRELIRSTFR